MSEHVTVYADTDRDEVADTLAVLENAGIPYTLVDITRDEDALAHVEKLGFTQTPVVEAGILSWAGFKPDLIAALAQSQTPGG
ncbi:NrdH-redoxin [Cryobacterium sp. 10S3]|uniref:NrdH-redoxin n=1 Tax=Cryobacterium sp. 10S3 TaxID=3048582 RepID=UPI002B221B3C|nr:NrdH-redoxin [Cryobacterium sp. 10S3]MEB0288537.1 NrdH-redoxin [Cryobacterium sp. 10S3]